MTQYNSKIQLNIHNRIIGIKINRNIDSEYKHWNAVNKEEFGAAHIGYLLGVMLKCLIYPNYMYQMLCRLYTPIKFSVLQRE